MFACILYRLRNQNIENNSGYDFSCVKLMRKLALYVSRHFRDVEYYSTLLNMFTWSFSMPSKVDVSPFVEAIWTANCKWTSKRIGIFYATLQFELELIYLYFPPSFHQTVVFSVLYAFRCYNNIIYKSCGCWSYFCLVENLAFRITIW